MSRMRLIFYFSDTDFKPNKEGHPLSCLTWLERMARRVRAPIAKRMALNLWQAVLSILGLSPGLHSSREYLDTPRRGRLLLRSLVSFFLPSLILFSLV